MYGLSDTVVADICSVFQRFPNIEEVLIFGSRAKGSYSEGSDIDLAAIGHDLTFNQLMDINIQIEDLGLLFWDCSIRLMWLIIIRMWILL